MTDRHLFVDILCVLFGIGTWLCVNGLWVELPILVQHLPEGWALPSYIAVIIQIANLGPITFTLLHSCAPTVVSEKRSIYFVMVLGVVALLFLSQFWMQVLPVGGENHAVAFFALVFILAAVDCSSRVLYLPFMARFKPEYLTCFFIGEGLSGLIPSLFALVQGAGGNPRCFNATDPENGTVIWTTVVPDPLFSVEIFFYFLVVVSVCSMIAFHLLNRPSIVSKCLAKQDTPENEDMLLNNRSKQFYNSTPEPMTATSNAAEPLDNIVNTDSYPVQVVDEPGISNVSIPMTEAALLMSLLIVICSFANGIFPSVQSYSCLPYGNSAYHWTVTLSNMANPAVCFLMLLIKKPYKPMLVFMTGAAFLVGSYVLYTAIQSPNPPLVDAIEGKMLLILAWIFLVGLFTYVKVTIATIMRVMGKKGLFWTGVFTQLGSSVGAIIAFIAVNFTSVFHSYNPCPQF